MKELIFKYWEYFYNKELGKFDGIKFEDLVSQLLALEYPNFQWKRTKPSWDGKRDFYADIIIGEEAFIEWAECKIYSKNLSINVISPTLIMSTLSNINKIIFFSYSKFNKNAIEILSVFSREHNVDIVLYDDEKLEQLIFKYENRINFNKYFPSYYKNKFNFISDIKFTENVYIYSKNRTYSLEEIKHQNVKIHEVFDLIITIENMSLTEQNVSISMDLLKDDMYKYFELADKSLQIKDSIVLSPCQITSFRIHIKLIKYKKQISIPEININSNNSYLYLSSYFNVSWLVEIPLIAYNNLLEDIKERIQDDAFCVGFVHGTSGIGKTRLLQEIHKNNLLCGIKSTYINSTQNENSSNWIKRLLSDYYKLPILSINKDELNYNILENSSEKNLVLNILYNDKFNIEKNTSKITSILLKILSSEKRVLLIDNVQNFDDNSIKILNEIISSNDIIEETNLIISINTDYVLLDSAIYSFNNRLLSLCNDDKCHYKELHLSGFSKDQSKIFINACFGYDYLHNNTNLQYDTYIDKISNASQNNPLFIEQVLIHLCSEGIIYVNEDHFSIFDNNKFELTINTLPESLDKYFDKRYKILCQKYSPKIKTLKSILRLLCFLEHIPYELQLSMDLDDYCISILESFGIIKIQNGIVFYHQLLHKYFNKKFSSLTINEYKLCKNGIKDGHLVSELRAYYYFCRLKSSQLSNKLLIEAIITLTSNNVPRNMIPKYCEFLFKKLKDYNYSYDNESLTKSIILFFSNYCYYIRDNISYDEGLKQYENFYNNYILKIDEFKLYGKEVYRFILGYLNISLTMHNNDSVIEIGERALNNINSFQFNKAQDMQNAIMMLYNRMHIAYYRLQYSANSNYKSISQKYIRKSLNYAKKENNIFYIIQNEIDYGYLYYSNNSSKSKTISHWNKAYDILKNNPKDAKPWEYGLYYHKALIEAMAGNYLDSLKWIGEVDKLFKRKILTSYYYNKACLLDAIISFFTGESNNIVFEKIKFAENQCQKNNFKLGYPICSHLKAIYYQIKSPDIEKSKMYYKKAVIQYFQKWDSSELDIHKDFIIDLISTLYKIDNNITFENGKINLYYLSNKSHSKKFASFIYDKNNRINFPCV